MLTAQSKLQRKFFEIRAKNPAYSLRAFARKLELSPSSLSEILNGKRKLSRSIASRISDRLSLDPQERADFLGRDKSTRYTQLSMDQFHAIADWWHYGVLSLMNTQEFKPRAAWMAKRLGLPKNVIADAWTRLERLGLIVRDETGAFRRGQPAYRTTDDVASPALRRSHAANLDLGKLSLESDPVELRDFTAITMAIDPTKLPEAKKLIRAFQDDLSALVESGERTHVYKFCTQLIPLTKDTKSRRGRS